MDNNAMINRAKDLIIHHWNENYGDKYGTRVTRENVYIVWFCKTLQNWKALVSTDFPDQIYYEVTHNGDKDETYVDVYKKKRNYKVTGNYWAIQGGE